MKKLALLCTAASCIVPTAAFAQSTGTVETEKDTIVVTGQRSQRGVAGVVVQDATKAKGLLTQEFISKQNPGQTILNTINYIPGVNFTQNDPYGASGGSLRIRGFDGNRVSLTFDGVPLNDSGNYAIYSSQLLDPELIEQVNVNLGATDVDSPTASAAGGTVNFRSLIPTNQPGLRANVSAGTFDYRRAFMLLQTGNLTSFGTKAWIAASQNHYDHWRGAGKIDKWQVNGKIYQPLAAGDFVSISGHYNQSRNNNYNNPNLFDLRGLPGFGTAVVPSSPTDFPVVVGDYTDEQWDTIDKIAYASSCGTRAPGVNGTAQVDPSACTNILGTQINPANTGNIRGQSRFTLMDGLILTVDPTYQYVLANGGGQSTVIRETDNLLRQVGSQPGVDLNGDGDFRDSVLVGRPSITNTNRITLISSLVWRMDPSHTFRLAYTFDRARHRQTGEYSRTGSNFSILNPFFGRNGDPILTATGTVLQNRDRTSIAMLNQLAGQYIGRFLDQRLRVEVGVRSPWFKRDLDQNCYTPLTGAGFPVCVQDPASLGYRVVPNDTPQLGARSTDLYAPFEAEYKYSKLLPNVGATYAITDNLSAFASYAKGFSAPRTDNLYRSPFIGVVPETTNSFDVGARYISGMYQAQAALWKIDYKNRIVTSYDPDTNTSIDRNVGKVSSWGFEGGLGVRPVQQVNLIGLLSYTNAELKDDIIIGNVTYNSASPPTNLTPFQYFCSPLPTTGSAPVQVCGETTGKFVAETPRWQYGGRAEFNLAPVRFGIQAKRVERRFATDVNDVVVKGYTMVDADARIQLPMIPGNRTYLQVNVSNLLNERYFGNLSTTINAYGPGSSAPRFTPVATRAVSATLNFGF